MIQLNFETIQDAVESSINVEDVVNYGHESSKARFYFDTPEELISITIHWNTTEAMKSRQGVHLRNGFLDTQADLSFRLSDALESCFRDGFQDIYLHMD